jgi:hypothetical protein
MAWAQLFKPRTRDWGKARAALEDYIHTKEVERQAAVGGKRSAARQADAVHGH